MKVLVVNNMAPFVSGGAESMAAHLKTHLEAAGHEAEVLRIPFQWEPATRIPSQMLMARAFEDVVYLPYVLPQHEGPKRNGQPLDMQPRGFNQTGILHPAKCG